MRFLAIALPLVACSSEPSDVADADPAGYRTLVGTDWTIPQGSERYLCVRETVTRDVWISALRMVSPPGTHHSVLMVDAPDGPDGVTECTSALVAPIIYAGGIGTEPLAMPPGVAVRVRAGEQLLLNLHLFNADDGDLSEYSGVEIVEADPATVDAEAGVILAGKVQGLTVVPGLSHQIGTCTLGGATTVFAVIPHMHQLGTNLAVTHDGTGAQRVLHDQAYAFDEQRFHVLAPAQPAAAGDTLTVDCTYVNPTGTTVSFGESSNAEMCFAGVFHYPRRSDGPICEE